MSKAGIAAVRRLIQTEQKNRVPCMGKHEFLVRRMTLLSVILITMDITMFLLDIIITNNAGRFMKETIRTYYVQFAVETVHTEAIIKAYSEKTLNPY